MYEINDENVTFVIWIRMELAKCIVNGGRSAGIFRAQKKSTARDFLSRKNSVPREFLEQNNS